MPKRLVFTVIYAIFCAMPLHAQLQQSCPVPAVVPTENITSLEINPSLEVPENTTDTSLSKVTLKGYFAFNRNWNIGLEVPLARFTSPGNTKNGLGDISLMATGMGYLGETWSYGALTEFMLPTATDDVFGSGKVQFSPALFGVYMPNSNFFLSFGYKQYWSIAGDGSRADINTGRIRMVAAYLSDSKWWALLDPRYLIDYEHSGQMQFAPEAEIGTMINTGTSVYLRGGGKMGGNMPGTDWMVSIGFRILHL